VTGERDELPPGLADLVASVREASSVPAAVGFGIGTPDQAAQVGAIADGVIIGTRLVRLVADAAGPDEAADAAGSFLADVRVALAGDRDGARAL
jgi:tryptophan synthase alpha chain